MSPFSNFYAAKFYYLSENNNNRESSKHFIKRVQHVGSSKCLSSNSKCYYQVQLLPNNFISLCFSLSV